MQPDQDPLQVAVRALHYRDLSSSALDARLARAGVAAAEREQALATLARIGYLNDARVALRRAQTLAERGWGDRGIAADLEHKDLPAEVVAEAIAAVEPERERARRLVASRGAGPKTAAFLTRKGFGQDAVEQALVAEDA